MQKNYKKQGENITLSDFQIVNGCQTSHLIAKNKDRIYENQIKDMFVPIKLIATENNDIINSIIISTNRHNEVKKEAFESLSDFHKELENFYNSHNQSNEVKIYYARRSKQYMYNDNIKRNSVISLAEQIKTYLSMFLELPHSTHRYYGKLLKVYKEKESMFQYQNKTYGYFERYHISGLIFSRLIYFIEKKQIDSQYKIFRYHILLLVKLQIIKSPLNTIPSQKYNEIIQEFYNIVKDDESMLKLFKNSCNTIKQTLQDKRFNGNRKVDRIKDFTIAISERIKEQNYVTAQSKGI